MRHLAPITIKQPGHHLTHRIPGGAGLNPYDEKVIALNPTFYFPMVETAGLDLVELIHGSAWYGQYAATGVTYGVAGPGDGRTAVAFDASTGRAFPYSAPLSAAFMHSGKGTICGWSKLATWTGTSESIIRFQRDASNLVYIGVNLTSKRAEYFYVAGGVSKATSEGNGQSTLDWRHYAITWDIDAGASGELKGWIDATQIGSTQTSLGTWGAVDLISALCGIGSQGTASPNSIAGSYGRWAGYPVALTQAQLATLAGF